MLTWLAILVYFALVLGIGYWTYHGETRLDYLIAERKASPLVAGLSIVASWIDAPIFFTFITLGYLAQWDSIWLYMGFFIGMSILALMSPKIRELTEKHGNYTFPGLIIEKTELKLGTAYNILTFLVFTALSVLQLYLGATILSDLSGIGFTFSIIAMATITTIYLCLGGFKASLKTDVVQVLFLLLFAVFLLFMVLLSDHNPTSPAQAVSLQGFKEGWGVIVIMIYGLLFSSDGWPRVIATRSVKEARHTMLWGMFFLLGLGFIFSFVGYYVVDLAPGLEGDAIPFYVLQDFLPDSFEPFFMVVLFGIVMSSLDTYVLVAAQSLMNDGLARFGLVSDDRPRLLMRYGIPVVLVLASIAAFFVEDIVVFFFYIVMFMGAGVPPVLAILSNRTDNLFAIGFGSAVAFFGNFVLLIMGNLTEANSAIASTVGIVLWFVLSFYKRKTINS